MITKTAAAIALILCLAACSHDRGAAEAANGSPSDAPATGTLTGLVRMYGGPMNPKTGKQALNGSAGSGWPVKVLSGGHTVAEGKSDATGKFRFRLVPGRYTLECGRESKVVVLAGQTVSVDCKVPVP